MKRSFQILPALAGGSTSKRLLRTQYIPFKQYVKNFATSIVLIAILFLAPTACTAQIKDAATATIKVDGNCGLCKAAIEKAVNKTRISKADWNEQNKMATITYNSKKTSLNAILKSIAIAGFDNQDFLAPDEAYNNLPGCCKYERKNKVVTTMHAKGTAPSIQNNSTQQHDSMANTTQETNQLKAVFDGYFLLKDALVKTDGNLASAKANDLQTAVNAVDMSKLPMDVHVVWMKILSGLKEDTQNINGTKEISKQRDYFMSLSKNMYQLIKTAKPAETVYYQFCPMANDGKGANWLSKESGIKNPYYGAQMLTCGSTVETIKQ